jgi:hypothetical protein
MIGRVSLTMQASLSSVQRLTWEPQTGDVEEFIPFPQNSVQTSARFRRGFYP